MSKPLTEQEIEKLQHAATHIQEWVTNVPVSDAESVFLVSPKELAALCDMALASLREGEAVATLHDDGYWTWQDGASNDLKHKATFAGWQMEVYARPPAAPEQPERAAPAAYPRMEFPNAGISIGPCHEPAAPTGEKPCTK